MKNCLFSIYVIFSIFLFSKAQAGIFDLNLFYYSDSTTAATAASSGRTFYDFCLGLGMDKSDQYLVGWNYASYSTTDTSGSTTTTWAMTAMGPKFIIFFDKAKTWRIGAAYNLVTSATYQNGTSSSETWSGSSYSADLGYQLPLGSSFMFAARVNYIGSSFSSKLVGSSTYSTVSYSKSLIYPSIAFSYIW